jgi:hypothetical protein
MIGQQIARNAADMVADVFGRIDQTTRQALCRSLVELTTPGMLHLLGGRLAKHHDYNIDGEHFRNWLARRLATATSTGEVKTLRDSLGHDSEPWATFHRALVTLLDHEADVIAWAVDDPRRDYPTPGKNEPGQNITRRAK